MSAATTPKAQTDEADSSSNSLSELENELLELFTRMAQLVGLPKSIGQIYGILFASPMPLNLEDVATRLEISKGSASQGLRFLRTTGAVSAVQIDGCRSEHFIPETSLRALAGGFLKEQIEPHLDHGVERLVRLKEFVNEGEIEGQDVLVERIRGLERWHSRAISLVPLALRFLGR